MIGFAREATDIYALVSAEVRAGLAADPTFLSARDLDVCRRLTRALRLGATPGTCAAAIVAHVVGRTT